MEFSHFISLPLAIHHTELVDKLDNFRKSILANINDTGIEESIFANPKTLHLTLLMLKLGHGEKLKAAIAVLKGVLPKVIAALKNQPVMIRLKGLDCMKGTLAEAHIVYAPVEEVGDEGRLLKACQIITNAFVEAGLVMETDAQWELKLPVTLINSRFRKRKTWTREIESFDARGIFDQYGNEEWGEYRICEAHLSQRFAFDENGFNHCCASIPFPEHMQDGVGPSNTHPMA